MAVVALTTFALKKLQSAVSSCLTHFELFCPLFPFLVHGITKHAGKTAALPACWRGAGRGRCCSIIILLVDMTAMIELSSQHVAVDGWATLALHGNERDQGDTRFWANHTIVQRKRSGHAPTSNPTDIRNKLDCPLHALALHGCLEDQESKHSPAGSCFDFFTKPFILANTTRHTQASLHRSFIWSLLFTHQCAATLATAIVDEAKARVPSTSTACSLPTPRHPPSPTVPSTRLLPIT